MIYYKKLYNNFKKVFLNKIKIDNKYKMIINFFLKIVKKLEIYIKIGLK